ncbi:unnamed protein product [Adineta ricciae]|uniref:Uncharacterized protein n=1 Tax=Adineta ricciae TaxID=249248 RepID=A0A815CAL9_ADIRI|nr:unnamed protein product [Adineta ricciae]
MDENLDIDSLSIESGVFTKKRRRSLENLMHSNVSPNACDKENQTLEARVVYQTIDDMNRIILQNLEKKFAMFSKKLNQLIPNAVHQHLDSYREKDESFPSKLMYEGQNLLEIRGRDIYDYGRKILKTLYTSQELGSCILPPARNHLARPALDPVRFNIFHGM